MLRPKSRFGKEISFVKGDWRKRGDSAAGPARSAEEGGSAGAGGHSAAGALRAMFDFPVSYRAAIVIMNLKLRGTAAPAAATEEG